jgi:hypothetical protein
MSIRNPPPGATGRGAGKLELTVTVSQPASAANLIRGKLRQTVVELQKCVHRFDDQDSATVTAAVLGISLNADDLVELCHEHRVTTEECYGR